MRIRPHTFRCFTQFVPQYTPPLKKDVKNFNIFLNSSVNLLILTGAGVSTVSGIPDYRSEEVGIFSRSSYKPIQFGDFLNNPEARTRYWARNFAAWPRFKSFAPNLVHTFIAGLQVTQDAKLITQNVDGLHSKAGSKQVLELHGNAFWVKCMSCNDIISRYDFQEEIENANPNVKVSAAEIRPDGDAELLEDDLNNFKVPSCKKCGGILKPTVVFFGENVPGATVKQAEELVDNCDNMLILGTSLSTLSTYRLVEQAYDKGKHLCLVNIGETRCDKMMNLSISTNIKELVVQSYNYYSM